MALILMYLYYDTRGEIKGISPAPEAALDPFKYTTIPLDRVEKFLTGQANPFDYTVKVIPGKTPTIVKKEPIKAQPRSNNQFLTEITEEKIGATSLKFSINKANHRLRISVAKALLSLYNSYDEEDEDAREELVSVVQNYNSYVYATELKNPFAHICSISFNVKELFDLGEVEIGLPEEVDVENLSLYTKKLFEGYALSRR